MSYAPSQIAAIVIFAVTYLAIAWGRFPGLRLDRTGAALAGATCMIGAGALTLRQAYAAIDFDTITLLLGVMIVVATLRLSGLLSLISGLVARLTRRLKPERIYTALDWPLLLMFAGLFIVVAGLESVLAPQAHALAGTLHLQHAVVLAAFTAVLSNIVSNVPAVLVLRPFLGGLPHPQQAWLLVAMASTLAGNFTLLGSVANLIVAQRARALGVTIGFWTYFKVGAPLTILTLLTGTLWLAAR